MSLRSAYLAIAAGVCAGLHLAKLPPAIGALRQDLGLSLVEAGFALSMVQVASMCMGLAFGAAADALGARRSMLIGLLWVSVASAAGALSTGTAGLLLARAVEGAGVLLIILAAPAAIRRLVPGVEQTRVLGLWGSYFPLAMTISLLLGPWVIAQAGWRAWWWLLGAVSLTMVLGLRWVFPVMLGYADSRRADFDSRRIGLDSSRAALDSSRAALDSGRAALDSGRGTLDLTRPGLPAPASPHWSRAWLEPIRLTLRHKGPWLVALAFAVYSSQWLAVVGFLPTIAADAGWQGTSLALLTAAVAAANIVGNVGAGRLLHAGVAPVVLLRWGYGCMLVATVLAFFGTGPVGSFGHGWAAPAALRYLALIVFSALGGLVPGTLFNLAVRLAPGPGAVASTVGWMQQWSAAGQFVGPPVVAWLAGQVGGWQWSFLATGLACLLGLVLASLLQALLNKSPLQL